MYRQQQEAKLRGWLKIHVYIYIYSWLVVVLCMCEFYGVPLFCTTNRVLCKLIRLRWHQIFDECNVRSFCGLSRNHEI